MEQIVRSICYHFNHDNNPFGGCSNLTSIIVDSNNPKYDSRNNCNAIIETASNKLISGCQNTIFPANITTIEKEAFVGCTGLTSITIPNSVRKIGERAFWGCSGLTSVIISSGVRTIEGEAFLDCPRIASIVVDPNNPIFDSRDSCNAIIEKATNKLIVGCAGTTFPTSITTIGDYALRGCGIRTINVPNNVTHIGTDAFRECDSLVSAILPNSITSISNCLFCWCHNLTSVTIPNSVTSIGEDAFAECGFTSIIIPNSVTSLSTNAFVWCRSLMSVTIPSSVTFIGENAFTGCSEVYDVYCSANPANLTWINFNNCFRENKNTVCHVYDASAWQTKFPDANVTFVGDLSNYMCGENVSWDLADGVLTISGSGPMFDYEIVENTPWYDQRATIQSIVIEEGVTTIGNNAFKTCGATSVTIPNSVTRLGSQAFRGCNALTSVMIPRGVTTIGEGDEVFGDCPSITSIVVDSLNPVFDSRGGCNAIIETATNKLIVGCRNTVIPEGIVSIGGLPGDIGSTLASQTFDLMQKMEY